MFSQRVFVALDTGQGVVYAAASGWDRVYLLWLFRNFRSLAQNVLNPRQQRLIASLYREASKDHPHEGSEAIVVGTVEDFSPSSLPIFPSFVKAGKTARTSEKTSASVRALGRNLFFGRFAFKSDYSESRDGGAGARDRHIWRGIDWEPSRSSIRH